MEGQVATIFLHNLSFLHLRSGAVAFTPETLYVGLRNADCRF